MLREIVTDFVLFSFVEGLLYAMFFNRVCKCKKFNVFEIIVMQNTKKKMRIGISKGLY